MAVSPNARAGVEDAPGGLVVVQELLNTAAAGSSPTRSADLLADEGTAQAWLDDVLGARALPSAQLGTGEASGLRSLRSAVRAALHHRDGRGDRPTALSADVVLRLDLDGRVDVVPAAGAAALKPLVLAEILRAQERGDWARLKLCALTVCDMAFYDLSRNNSRRWDTSRCANHVNLRASRARRAGTA